MLALDEARGEHRLKLQRINDEILNWRYACSGADALHISSMFEGWLSGDAHVTASIADVPVRARSATLYDLIPLLFADKYLPPSIQPFYLAKLGLFQQLDLVFAISESSRQDAIRHLNILPERIINIRAAASATFRRLESIEPARARETLARYGLGPRFILYTGGIDFRKNIDALLVAYAALPAEITRDVQLAIVCAVTSDQRLGLLQRVETLGIMAATVFTGYIPDDDLNLLYNVCELFVFPSLYEGFGLPLLEAMTCGACVIASNTSSMPEIVGSPEVLFDPHDSGALTRMMRDLLMAPDRRRQIGASNHRRSREFSWDDVARRFIARWRELLGVNTPPPALRVRAVRKSPLLLPCRRNGVELQITQRRCFPTGVDISSSTWWRMGTRRSSIKRSGPIEPSASRNFASGPAITTTFCTTSEIRKFTPGCTISCAGIRVSLSCTISFFRISCTEWMGRA